MINLIFDYDGTLHESIRIYAPAFRKAQEYLVDKGLTANVEYSDAEISQWLGFTATEMWNAFAPMLAEEEKQICSNIIGEEMLRLTYNGCACLYPKMEDMLLQLIQRGYNLTFLSNCKKSYMEAHKAVFGLERFFFAFYCSEEFGFIPKHEIYGHIKHKLQGEVMIIGDRYQDMEVAIKYGLESVGCLYGYGKPEELSRATFLVENPDQLFKILCGL